MSTYTDFLAQRNKKTPTQSTYSTSTSNYENFKREREIRKTNPTLYQNVSSSGLNAITTYKDKIGDYNWLSDYYYDEWSDEDAQRQQAGQIPLYVEKKYNFKDPDDVALYRLGLPPKKLISSVAEKAEKAREKAEAETVAYDNETDVSPMAKLNPFKATSTEDSTPVADVPKQQTVTTGTAKPVTTSWLGNLDNALSNIKSTNPGEQQTIDRLNWERENLGDATDEEIESVAAELLKTGNYQDVYAEGGEWTRDSRGNSARHIVSTATEQAREDAKKLLDKQREQKWLEHVNAPKNADGSFIPQSKYQYEANVVADEMEKTAVNAEGFKDWATIQAEHADDRNIEWDNIQPNISATQSDSPIFKHMTDEQKAVYFYYKGINDDKANEYLNALTPKLTALAAKEQKEYFGESFVGSALLATVGGLESGFRGLARTLNGDDYALRSEGVTTESFKQARAETSGAAGVVADILYSVGNMLPSMGMGFINPVVGAATLGASTAGNTYTEARNGGATKEQAVALGVMTGLSEAFLQYVLGGISKLGSGVLTKNVSKSITGTIAKVIQSPKALKVIDWIVGKTSNMGGEALEEYLQSILEPQFRNIALGEKNEVDLLDPEALYSALLGALTSFAIGGSADTDTQTNTPVETAKSLPEATQTDGQTNTPATQETAPQPQIGDVVRLADGSVGTVKSVVDDVLTRQIGFGKGFIVEVPDVVGTPVQRNVFMSDISTNITQEAKATETADVDVTPDEGEIPNIEGLAETIKKREGAASALDDYESAPATDRAPKMYAQDVRNNAPSVIIPASPEKINIALEQNSQALEAGAEELTLDQVVAEEAVAKAQGETGTSLIDKDLATELAMIVPKLKGTGVKYGRTLSQNADYMAANNREVRNVLVDVYERPLRKAQRQQRVEVEEKTAKIVNEAERVGIKNNSIEDNATLWYGQRYKAEVDENGNVTKKTYGINELREDCPDTWRQVMEYDRVNRQIYDDYAEKMTEMYKRIYPNAEANANAEVESARVRAEEFDVKLGNALDRAKALEQALIETEKTINSKKQDGTKTYQKLKDRQARLQRQLEEANTEVSNRREQADMAAVRLFNIERANKTGELLIGKRFFKRSDYYAHMSEQSNSLIEAIRSVASNKQGIDPLLAGISANTKPKSKWASVMQRRLGIQSELSATNAMKQYINLVEYLLAYNPVIAQAREATQIIRQSGSMDGSNNAALEKIIDYLDDWTNDLAGKTNPFDRDLMKVMNRNWLNGIKKFNGRVKGNAIIGNVATVIVQIGNIPIMASFIKNPKYWIQGAKMMALEMKNGGFENSVMSQSAVMSQRTLDRAIRNIDPDSTSAMEKITSNMLEAGDIFASKLGWWSAYSMYNALDGKVDPKVFTRDYADAIEFADDVIQRSVAGRAPGDIPLTQKSEKTKFLAPFMVEVNNQWQTFKQQTSNKTTGSANVKGLITMSIATYLINSLLEGATGNRPLGLDFIQMLIDAGEILGDEDKTTSEKVFEALGRAGGEMLSSHPFGTQIAGFATSFDQDASEALFGENDPTRYGVGNIGLQTITDPLIRLAQGKQIDPLATISNVALPYGGKQLKRVVETAQNMGLPNVSVGFTDGLKVTQAQTPTSYTTDGNVRYAADTDPLSILQSLMFGQYSTPSGREYVASGARALNDENTALYNELANSGMNGKDILNHFDKLSGFKPIKNSEGETAATDLRRQYIQHIPDITTRQEMLLLSSIDERFLDKAVTAQSLGISNEQFINYTYEMLKTDMRYAKYKKNAGNDAKSGVRGKWILEYLKSQNYSEEQALYLYELAGGLKWNNRDKTIWR